MKPTLKSLNVYIPLVLILGVIMNACVSDQIAPKEIAVPDEVSFATDIVPIFESSCNQAGCHNNNGIPPVLTPEAAWVNLIFFNYVDTVNSENSFLWTKIDDGGSMAQYLSDEDKAFIFQWIEQDAPNN